MSSSNTVYLITGTTRGLGKGLVEFYLSKPNNTLIAAVRDPTDPTAKALSSIPAHSSSKLIVVKIDSEVKEDAANAIAYLTSTHDIKQLDVVIANAGILKVLPTILEAKVEDIQEHFLVNVIGVVVLFQAVAPLLKKSDKAPKFVTISSLAATITEMGTFNYPNVAYGTSKAALNYITRKIHFENPAIIAFPIEPGFADTDMGIHAAKSLDVGTYNTVQESVDGMVKVISEATREATSGEFMSYTGKKASW